MLKRKALTMSTSVFAVTSGDGMKTQGDMEVDSSANAVQARQLMCPVGREGGATL